jgi:hypothetical protein
MPDELDEEEQELLKKHRAKKAQAAKDDKEVWIKQGDNEAAIPYSKGRAWLQKTFGIDLDEEPVQGDETPAEDDKPASASKSPAQRRFGVAR